MTLKKLEVETKATINVPKKKQDGNIGKNNSILLTAI